MSVVFDIKVIPQSGKQLFKLDKNGSIVCYIKSSPERGQANAEIVKLIAQLCSVSQIDVAIIMGATSRKKRIKINTEHTYNQILSALGIIKQMNMFE